jgi:hypothetical protein
MKIFPVLAVSCMILEGLVLLTMVAPSTTAGQTPLTTMAERTAPKSQPFLIVGLQFRIPLSPSTATGSPDRRQQPPNLETKIQILLHTDARE